MLATPEQSKVKIGRREFDYNTFIIAVQKAKTYSELCESLEMNKTVQTTINVLAVKENIENATDKVSKEMLVWLI